MLERLPALKLIVMRFLAGWARGLRSRGQDGDRHDLRNLVADHVLLRMPNVVVTPHSPFNTREAVGRIVETTVANIESCAAGRPQNLVAAASGKGLKAAR